MTFAEPHNHNTPMFQATVADAGGGEVRLIVARSTKQYPRVGEWLTITSAEPGTASDHEPCPYCTPQPGDTPESLAHSPERCPRVAAISYRSDGSIRRVEFSR